MRRALADQRGGIAAYILGAALTFLLLVGGLGLAEGARAGAVKTRAARALAAAVDSAARQRHTENETAATPDAIFHRMLKANLGSERYTATLTLLPAGAKDPTTAARLDRPALVGRLTVPYRLEYVAPWLPEISLHLSHTALTANRKTAP